MKTTALTADSIQEVPAVETEAPKTAPILDVAWARYSNLNASALKGTRTHYTIRRWIAILGVLATLFAILSQFFHRDSAGYMGIIGLVVRVLLVTAPIIASSLAAISTRAFSNGDWLVKRAGAEEILKEIYFFRTILQKKSDRRVYIEKRLNEIQRQLFRTLGGEFSFETYNGQIPPNFVAGDPNSDPGFADLTGDEYFRYRVEEQLRWHNKKVNQFKVERFRLQVYIVLFGAAGALLAAFDQTTILVALTASLTAAYVGWQELRNLDSIIKNYSKVVMELTIVYDHWLNLEPEERTDAEFYKMVRSSEDVLWAQNTEYIQSMQEALKDADLEEEASLVNRTIKESVESAARSKEMMRETLTEASHNLIQKSEVMFEEHFQSVVGYLVEEAASEVVQKELDAMSKAATEFIDKAVEKASGLTTSLTDIAKEFAHVDIGRDTSKDELNAILVRYPKTNDVKG